MADVSNIVSVNYCFSCLSSRTEEKQFQIYHIQQTTLKSILRTEQILLCHICKKVAKNTELFLHNVETAHYFLLGLKDVLNDNVDCVMRPIVNLTVSPTELINLEKEEDDDGCEHSLEQLTHFPEVQYIKEEQNEEILAVKETALLHDANVNSLINQNEMNDDNVSVFLEQSAKTKVSRAEYRNNIATSEKCLENTEQLQEQEIDSQKELDSLMVILQISQQQCLNELAAERLHSNYVGAEFKCDDCIKRFASKTCFDKHMEKHSELSGNCVCNICKIRFGNDDELLLHVQCHMRRYQCKVCHLTKANREEIERHILYRHRTTSQFQCPTCNKLYKDNHGLKLHLSRTHQNEAVECWLCKKYYSSKCQLKKHVCRCHDSSEPVRYPCEVCGSRLKTATNLKVHMKTHSDTRNFYCVECNKYFKTQANLDNHHKLALGHVADAEKHPCPKCNKIFRTKSRFDCHMNYMHTNFTRRYYCDQCGKNFRNKRPLADHIQEHMGIERARNFVCIVCSKAFHTQTLLSRHRNTHTGETPYHCAQCPAQFGHPASLYNHRMLVHEKRKRKRANAQHKQRKDRDSSYK